MNEEDFLLAATMAPPPLPAPASKTSASAGQTNDPVATAMFNAIRQSKDLTITRRDFETAIEHTGILLDDPRIRETVKALRRRADLEPITLSEFADSLHPSTTSLLHRALRGDLIIPDFQRFRDKLTTIFDFVRDYDGGNVATYIPQLARVDPDLYAIAVCTVDGQRMSLGDVEERYCVQSTCKPINYAIAMDTLGQAQVQRHVGREPSGRSFNELTLNNASLPHNPMINAGAIMCSALIKPGLPLADRFDYVMSVWRSLAGNDPAGFDNSVYLSEKDTADRNFALAYFMRENKAFPPDTDLIATLDFYFQCCSITVDVKQMATVAATFANGGICPMTDKRVFSPSTTKNCLSLMYSCGMYDFSGEYAFSVGLPAKSGVSGAMFIVVPGVCGIALYSPRLDSLGNTVRGVEFSKRLVETFPFHTYANVVADHRLVDPRRSEVMNEVEPAFLMCAAGARGDVSEMRRLIAKGTDVNSADYDGRTGLHLAASEGHTDAVRFLIDQGARIDPKDRWGNTPLDDAVRGGHATVEKLLRLVGEELQQIIGTAAEPGAEPNAEPKRKPARVARDT